MDVILEAVLGDISHVEADAIVKNAPSFEESLQGEVSEIKDHGLRTKHLISAVGPEWEDGPETDEENIEILKECYRNSMRLASSLGARSIAFPSFISYGGSLPSYMISEIAVSTVREFLHGKENKAKTIGKVSFVCEHEVILMSYAGEIVGMPSGEENSKKLGDAIRDALCGPAGSSHNNN